MFDRGGKESVLTKEKGKLSWAFSHGQKYWNFRIGITDARFYLSTLLYLEDWPLSGFDFLSSKTGRTRMVYLQIYQANCQICDFPSKKGQEIITMWSQEV